MIDPVQYVADLRRLGLRFFTGVPDSLLKEFCACLAATSDIRDHIIAANEGGAVALAIGYHLATGDVPVVYMQNSGLGNIVNPLLSLADPEVYSVPMILLIGWRGEPGVKDEPQHKKQGRVMRPMLEAMEVPTFLLEPTLDDAAAATVMAQAEDRARATCGPVAVAVRAGSFAPYTTASSSKDMRRYELSREEAVGLVLDALHDDDAVVSTTGMISREVFEHRARGGLGHQRDFLTVGGMGHASQIALGIALQQPTRRVVCLDGDGAVLMHTGALCITGSLRPTNLYHVVLNNGAHDSVGGQPTVGFQVGLGEIARASGYGTIVSADTADEVRKQLAGLLTGDGPALLEIRVRRGARKDLGRPTTTPVQNKQALMSFLGVDPHTV
ncbi:MAG: phosphonopyruvate decarboxylase [Nitrospiraceae bacterium]